MRAWLALLLVACAPSSSVDGDRRVLRSRHGYQTVSMLDGGRTGLYFDWGERVGQVNPAARRVVLLGMGGGEMLRAARRTLPSAELVGVELDPDVAAVAISDFGVLELGAQVVVDEGLHYLSTVPAQSLDGLIVDVFDDDSIPRQFLEPESFDLERGVLAPSGVLLMNVYPASLAPSVVRQLERAGFRSAQPWGLVEGNVMVLAIR